MIRFSPTTCDLRGTITALTVTMLLVSAAKAVATLRATAITLVNLVVEILVSVAEAVEDVAAFHANALTMMTKFAGVEDS